MINKLILLFAVTIFSPFSFAEDLKVIHLCYAINGSEIVTSTLSLDEAGTPLRLSYYEDKLYGGVIEFTPSESWLAIDRNDPIEKYKYSNFKSTLFNNQKEVASVRAIKLDGEPSVKFDENLYEVRSTDGVYAYSLAKGGRDYSLGSECLRTR